MNTKKEEGKKTPKTKRTEVGGGTKPAFKNSTELPAGETML